jgi:NadR type nicotinamide-nucleotide adenylyltransferase
MAKEIMRIAITGPESTGKSWLAEQLAGRFRTVWVPEFARAYLEGKGGHYDYEDIVRIARGQKALEQKLLPEANQYLFCDTDPLVTRVWSEVVYGKCDPWILKEIRENPYDVYLLCYPDLPWEPDPLRENPDDRDRLFELYKQTLEDEGLPYTVIKGAGNERLKNAVRAIENMDRG